MQGKALDIAVGDIYGMVKAGTQSLHARSSHAVVQRKAVLALFPEISVLHKCYFVAIVVPVLRVLALRKYLLHDVPSLVITVFVAKYYLAIIERSFIYQFILF